MSDRLGGGFIPHNVVRYQRSDRLCDINLIAGVDYIFAGNVLKE